MEGNTKQGLNSYSNGVEKNLMELYPLHRFQGNDGYTCNLPCHLVLHS